MAPPCGGPESVRTAAGREASLLHRVKQLLTSVKKLSIGLLYCNPRGFPFRSARLMGRLFGGRGGGLLLLRLNHDQKKTQQTNKSSSRRRRSRREKRGRSRSGSFSPCCRRSVTLLLLCPAASAPPPARSCCRRALLSAPARIGSGSEVRRFGERDAERRGGSR